ncbi:hypothetical protein CFP56_020817 [Quercus suber]|uniref:Uncharacterized protein n=1 Tax=Quercus suber TaxID=58331 RepID=A0AAW0KGQ4_QUESU
MTAGQQAQKDFLTCLPFTAIDNDLLVKIEALAENGKHQRSMMAYPKSLPLAVAVGKEEIQNQTDLQNHLQALEGHPPTSETKLD